jgi:hypothetical protein
MMDSLTSVVNIYTQQNRKKNTKIAYNPKVTEFRAFCDFQYPYHPPSTRYTVVHDNFYRFMFYQVFREKKVSRGRKRGVSEKFDSADYNRVIEKYSALLSTLQIDDGDPENVDRASIVDPDRPLKYSQINTYRSSIRSLFDEQKAACANGGSWEQVNNLALQKLMTIVNGREKRTAKRTYAEKVEGEASTFHCYSQI